MAGFDSPLLTEATNNLRDLLTHAFTHTGEALVLYDTQAPLTRLLTEAYRQVLPSATFLEVGTVPQEQLLEAIQACTPGDLVVQVQSTGFRLNAFRIRIELFKRGLKAIEHVQLSRMTPQQEATYIRALAYDPAYYRTLGPAIAARLDGAHTVTVTSPSGAQLTYTGGMEPCKLNIADYRSLPNVGGTFPIGEVITEAKDLYALNGEAELFAYAGRDHHVRVCEPFRVVIQNGILSTDEQAPEEFCAVLDLIRETEPVLVREFGVGINPAIHQHAPLDDVTAFERQYGLHLSLGQKHGIYKKPGLNRKQTRYHIDVFLALDRIETDGTALYQHGTFTP